MEFSWNLLLLFLFFFVRDLKYRVVGIAIKGRHRVFFVIIDLIEQWLGQPCRTLVVFGVTCFNAKILDVFLCESFPLFPLNFSLLSSLFSVFSLPSSFSLSSLFFHIFFLFLSLIPFLFSLFSFLRIFLSPLLSLFHLSSLFSSFIYSILSLPPSKL